MSSQDILSWIMEHNNQSITDEYNDAGGNITKHTTTFGNGDVLEHIEIYESIMRKRVITSINGRIMRKEELESHLYGWKTVTKEL